MTTHVLPSEIRNRRVPGEIEGIVGRPLSVYVHCTVSSSHVAARAFLEDSTKPQDAIAVRFLPDLDWLVCVKEVDKK